MFEKLKEFFGGGRKYRLVLGVILVALVNDLAGLGISSDTISDCLLAAVGGSGTIALEDGLRGLFGAKPKPETTEETIGEIDNA
jgi:hypothetical protein